MTDKAAIRELREKVEAGQIAPSDFELMASAVFDRRTLRFATSAELGSLDAALALHEAVLPGWRVYDLMQYVNGHWSIEIERIDGGIAISAATDNTPARAWLIAILKAMEND